MKRALERKIRRRVSYTAFTLVEILVAVAILVILISIMVKLASGVRESAKITETQTKISLLESAVNTFRDIKGYLPLSVPYDAWGNWNNFVDEVNWDGVGNNPSWLEYFVGSAGRPDYSWSSGARPTNIHMLVFQLEQLPESRTILERFRRSYRVDYQKSFHTGSPGKGENWRKEESVCKIRHPLDNEYRPVYQPQDSWGIPFRYWTADLKEWWNGIDSIDYFKDHVEGGFFIESAGPDGKFGWWDKQSLEESQNGKLQEDNIFAR